MIASGSGSEQEEARDDVVSIPYLSRRIDYMKDVFRPKVFVAAKGSSGIANSASTTEVREGVFRSIYDGIYEFGETKRVEVEKSGIDPSEEEDARALFQRIQEIEEKHKENCAASPIEDSSFPQFGNKRCGCIECRPRFDSDGSMYCALCSMPLKDGTWMSHIQSICHQLKRKREGHVYINPFMDPKSSMFKVMTEMGWEEGNGLGVNGKGRLEPIATRVKNNKLGVGAKDPS